MAPDWPRAVLPVRLQEQQVETPLSLPLDGIRVLDLTRLLPGAFATLMLAELGAEVIKIEDPRGGDPMRRLPPLIGGRGIYHLLLDRGKKSVTVDLKDPSTRPAFDRLLATADVVVESFRPAAAKRLGVSAGDLRTRFPRLVHCSVTGYGQTGPYAERPGHDLNYVAVSGMLAVDRPRATDLPRMFIADVGGGAMSAAVAILAALVGRERGGGGASLDVSMHEAMLYWVMVPAAGELVDGLTPAAEALPTFGKHACYNVYRTKDGEHIALGALEPKFWTAFCKAIGRSDLAARQHTGDEDQRALLDEVRAIFADKSREEWLALLEGHDLCLTPVNTPRDAFLDPHIVERGTLTSSPGLRAVRPPFVTHTRVLDPAPALGADTAWIMSR